MSLESDIVFLVQTIVSIIISYGLGVILIQQLIKRKFSDANYKTAFIVNGTFILFGVLMAIAYNFFSSAVFHLPVINFTVINIFWSALRTLINIIVLMILLRLFYRDTYKHGLFVGIAVKSVMTFITLITFHLTAVMFSVLTGGGMSFLII
ncbi:MAG: hypothetical protein ACW98X_02120 [Promethearchaeota archaeon]|jgi:hypothetical protein